jgi:protein ImuA
MEEGLRCSALSGVVGEIWGDPQALDFTATRRLAVAAERHGVACWLIRPGGQPHLSGARERWRLASAPSLAHPFDPKAPGQPRWQAELFRSRRRARGTWLVGAGGFDEPASLLPVVPAPGDRALGEPVRRTG